MNNVFMTTIFIADKKGKENFRIITKQLGVDEFVTSAFPCNAEGVALFGYPMYERDSSTRRQAISEHKKAIGKAQNEFE